MCGIVGYIGENQAAPILLDGLSKLEYRGYDSAGVAVYDGEKIQMVKATGRLKVLEELTQDGAVLPGTSGIGHTRWATHGSPSDANAHPHFNKDQSIVVVHNGIIENYVKLKKKMESRGYQFVSETDTEVIAHMLDYYYNGNPLDTIVKIMHRVEGSYALGILFRDHPDEVYAVRKDSPLIVGLGEGENFIASDIPAILSHTRDIYRLEDNEIVTLKADGVTVYNMEKEVIAKTPFHVDWDVSAAEKGRRFRKPDFKKVDVKLNPSFFVNMPGFLKTIFRSSMSRKVRIVKDKCVGCGKCKMHCPGKAITITKHKAHIDQKKCIRCYCCQELCPKDAVAYRKALMTGIVRTFSGTSSGKIEKKK